MHICTFYDYFCNLMPRSFNCYSFLHSKIIFSLIFYLILPMKTTLLPAYRPTVGWGGNTNEIRFGVLEDYWDYFWSCQIFIPPNAIIVYFARYEPKSLHFGQSTQFGGGLDLYEWRWPWMKIHLRCNLKKGLPRAQKDVKISLFEPTREFKVV